MHDLIFGQRLQHVDAAARKQRGVDLERRILGGSADQADVAFFHVGQKGILLSFVETVNLIDEDDGARAVLTGALGVGHDLLDLFNPGEHGGEFDKLRLGHAGDDLRQRSLARARRSPEDERTRVVAVDLCAQRLAGTDQVFLAGELFKRTRTHTVSQRSCAVGGVIGARSGLEKSHGQPFHHRVTETQRKPKNKKNSRELFE